MPEHEITARSSPSIAPDPVPTNSQVVENITTSTCSLHPESRSDPVAKDLSQQFNEDGHIPRRSGSAFHTMKDGRSLAPAVSQEGSLRTVASPSPFPATQLPESKESESMHTYPEGGLRANLVVLGAFCAMLSCFGLMNTVGTLQTYLSTNQLRDYSPSAIGWIFSIYIFMAFFCGVQIGPIFDAHGPRWLILSGTVLIVGGVLATGSATKYWHFILSFSIVSGLGTSLLFTPSVSAIAHWFAIKRGTATGLATTAGSVGGVIWPLALPELFGELGFEWGMRLLALIFLVLCIFANLLIRSRLPPKRGGSVWPDFTIFRNPDFTATTAGVFFIEWGLFVPITFMISFALHTEVGSERFSYSLLAILNASSFFGRWLPGFAADRWGRFNVMSAVTLLGIVSLMGFWLPGSLFGPARSNISLAVLFALGFGFASGSGISLTPVCVGQLCEIEEYGRYYATCYTIVSFGCLTGVPIAGEIVSRSGGEYYGLVAFTTTCYLVALACFWIVRVRAVGWGVREIY